MNKTMRCVTAMVAGLLVHTAHADGPDPYAYPAYPGAGPGYGPGAYPSWQRPGWSGPATRPLRTGMRVERTADSQAYYVTLHLNGLKPQDLTIRTGDRDLWIQSAQSEQTDQVETEQGYYRRFEIRSSSLNKHLRLPPDADVKNLVQEDGDNTIRFIIPRFQYR